MVEVTKERLMFAALPHASTRFHKHVFTPTHTYLHKKSCNELTSMNLTATHVQHIGTPHPPHQRKLFAIHLFQCRIKTHIKGPLKLKGAHNPKQGLQKQIRYSLRSRV